MGIHTVYLDQHPHLYGKLVIVDCYNEFIKINNQRVMMKNLNHTSIYCNTLFIQFYHAHNIWKDCHLLSAPGGADVAGDASVNEL